MNNTVKSFIVGYGWSLAFLLFIAVVQDYYEDVSFQNPTLMSENFEERVDIEKNCVWVKPKWRPEVINYNGLWTYFWIKDGKPSNFRFVFQYAGKDWLHVKKITFTCENSPKQWFFTPTMNRDCSIKDDVPTDRRFWEWCDGPATGQKWDEFMQWLDSAKYVTVSVQGRKDKVDFGLSRKTAQALKDSYHYYVALGGKL